MLTFNLRMHVTLFWKTSDLIIARKAAIIKHGGGGGGGKHLPKFTSNLEFHSLKKLQTFALFLLYYCITSKSIRMKFVIITWGRWGTSVKE